MASLLPASTLRELEGVFATYDRSGEGLIDQQELGVMLRALGLYRTEAEVQDIVSLVDADGSGKLDFAEFVNLMTSRLKDTDVDDEEAEAFARFDADGNGLITLSDLQTACATLEEPYAVEEIKEMIKEAALSGREGLTFDDFKQLLRSN